MCSLHPLEEEGGHPGPSHSRWTVTEKALQTVWLTSTSRQKSGARGSGGGAYWLTGLKGQVLASQLPLRLLLLLHVGRIELGKWRLTKQEVHIVQHCLSEVLRLKQKATRTKFFNKQGTLDKSLKVLKTKYNTWCLSSQMQRGIECNYGIFFSNNREAFASCAVDRGCFMTRIDYRHPWNISCVNNIVLWRALKSHLMSPPLFWRWGGDTDGVPYFNLPSKTFKSSVTGTRGENKKKKSGTV